MDGGGRGRGAGAGSRVKVVGQVDRVDGRSLTYPEFVERFMKPNLPVVLTGLTSSWQSCEDWTLATPDDRCRPNLAFFAQNFPSPLVQVADCSSREFTDQKRLEMSMQKFVDHWVGKFCTGSSNGDSEGSLLYLKDWHFVKEYPDYVAYTTPPFFVDDWLNMYLDSHPMHRDPDIANHKNEINCADYRFVYMGAKGTWTPLHADVFRSYSWSANVCGRKLWLFLPPSQSHLMFDRTSTAWNVASDKNRTHNLYATLRAANKRKLDSHCALFSLNFFLARCSLFLLTGKLDTLVTFAFDLREDQIRIAPLDGAFVLSLNAQGNNLNLRSSVYDINDDVSEKQFPEFNKTEWLECFQEQNEIIFVPSGWYHQVHNLEDTISINHNWFNAYNLQWVWNLLHEDYKVAKEYIEDIRDICDNFEGLCQRNLAANTGMNFYDFFIFITRFVLANVIELYHIQKPEDAKFESSETTHRFVYNLMSIRDVASKMVSTEAFSTENLCIISKENRSAVSDVTKILEEDSFRRLWMSLSEAYEHIGRGQRNCHKMGYLNRKGCLSVSCLKSDCSVVDHITSLVCEIHGPEDLVRLIDTALYDG